MTRALIPGLDSPHPIGEMLPAVYLDDQFVLDFVGALDAVVAPIFLTLDNLEAHFDPMLAPDDFVLWLADWVGLMLDETWPIDFARDAIARTVELYAWRGTMRGIRDVLELYTGDIPEIIESGGTAWSVDPSPTPPGSPTPALTIRLNVSNPTPADIRRLDLIVRSLKPAHVPHRLEFLDPRS